MSRTPTVWSLAAVPLALAACLLGCDPPRSDPVAVDLPSRAEFAPVSAMLGARCGSLTCHGAAGRNLRLYDLNGRRLSPADISGAGGGGSTEAEIDANYLSVISLEPELLAEVVRAGGAGADTLTLVRKARGTEAHAGVALFTAGDQADHCLLSWLAGHTDAASCAAGAKLERPY